MSLTENTNSNSSPAPPKKPERSFLEAAGNTANIYKFDCDIERNNKKHNSGSLEKVVANQTSVTNSTDQTTEKKKKEDIKKEKKEKKDRKKEKGKKSAKIEDDVKTLNNFEEIENKEKSRLEMERDDIWSAELSPDIEKESKSLNKLKVRSETKNYNTTYR